MKPRIRYVPRWVAETLVIPANKTVLVSSTVFANIEVWPLQLHWLSVTGDPTSTAAEVADGDYANSGGVARRLAWELGLSQEGEVNLVAGNTDALFAPNSYRQQLYSQFDDALKFRFPIEYELAPDSGLVAEVASADPNWLFYNPSILINALRSEGREVFEPVQFAGTLEANLAYPSSVSFDAADLFNSGLKSAYLKEMLLKPGQLTVNTTTTAKSQFQPQLNKTRWRMNPNNDIPWMPQDELIPAGNIAPFNRASRDIWDEGPRSYVFPTGTKLEARQRLTARITNLNETTAPDGDQTITVCMFGLLEVS